MKYTKIPTPAQIFDNIHTDCERRNFYVFMQLYGSVGWTDPLYPEHIERIRTEHQVWWAWLVEKKLVEVEKNMVQKKVVLPETEWYKDDRIIYPVGWGLRSKLEQLHGKKGTLTFEWEEVEE